MSFSALHRALGAGLALCAAASTARAQYTIYTDRAAFESALASAVIETFDAGALSAPGLASGGTNNGAIDCVRSGGCVWVDRVANGGAQTTWTFAGKTSAFGGNWVLTLEGGGQGIRFFVTSGGVTMLVPGEVPNSYTGQFYGFTSTTPFDAVWYDGGTQVGRAEAYTLDNLTFGGVKMDAAATVTPEPASVVLVGGGLLSLAAAARRRRRSA